MPRMVAVVNVGMQLKAAGAHYLWGAWGDGKVPMVPDQPGSTSQKTFMRCASLNGGTSNGVCAGRSGADDVRNKRAWDGKDPKAPGTQFRWPRYFEDRSTDNSPKVASGLVYGEDCTGKPHFDCAGFVRHCFRSVLGAATIPYATLLMRSKARLVWPADGNRGPISSVHLWPADLLYDDGYAHVGIATGHWLLCGYGVTNPSNALHCYSATTGVVMTPIDRFVTWKYAYRWENW